MVITEKFNLSTKGNTDVVNITEVCDRVIGKSGIRNGVITVFNPGSTGAITTIEYEPNLVEDFQDALELIAPADKVYKHGETWDDDNGSSHIRSTLIGPSITVPFVDGRMTLGTWQQIVFCDFDTRPRERCLVAQIIGE
ncbi:MAG: secondary thiamine-phosphate synthase enzyme YjbQ [Candidatus Omnitrophota bacterium]